MNTLPLSYLFNVTNLTRAEVVPKQTSSSENTSYKLGSLRLDIKQSVIRACDCAAQLAFSALHDCAAQVAFSALHFGGSSD